ncbi:L,D-transpeptidase family protein [Actinomyces howellii]|uniref:L,D-transpeptidase family protein n=1 Tax=Actinomyces howellii TaxID=52771 RepID=UPI001E432E92|nr:L,D-transpeptidase family protein [Actinomyces howellii]
MSSPYGQVTGTVRPSSRPAGPAPSTAARSAATLLEERRRGQTTQTTQTISTTAPGAGASPAAATPDRPETHEATGPDTEIAAPVAAPAAGTAEEGRSAPETELSEQPEQPEPPEQIAVAPPERATVSAPTPQAAAEPAPVPAGATTSLAPAAADASGAGGPDAGSRRRRRLWPLFLSAAALLLLGAVGAGGYAYADHYADVAVPGSLVAGVDVSGMSRQEIVSVVQDRADGATVTVSGDASASASLADLGVTVDAGATADAVLARGEGVVDRFRALLGSSDTPVVVSSDPEVAQAYATSLVPEDVVKAVNATVVLNAEGTGFEITPASSGTSLDSSVLEDAADQAASSLSDSSVEVTFESSPPAVSDEEAQAVADTANSWVSQDVTITAADSSGSYTADAATKASWVTVSTEGDTVPSVSLDPEKVSQWVSAQVEEVTVEPVTGVRNVNSQGAVVETSVEAVAGESVTNADAIVQAITEAVSTGTSYTGAFEMTTAEETWEDKVIADGAENLVYQAAPGEKWIDINLANKTVTAYEGATVVRGPVSMVDGDALTPTVTGTYKVYLQRETQTMEGDNADGTRYRTENVPWISYFHEGYALHGAPWRSSFGYSGSHGCINMPVEEAHWFYTWAQIGTTVVSHY